ncbi:hypothetical protein [Salibacterium aidingense]|uniref:hypothetical protein n=1 Tax=Salibacterium aidingense TaxID=384933 RepID=UPI000416C17A|nr:hypothetical protein [Salibacterium aidingense]
MKPVHVRKKLTKAQKKVYIPHALPKFPIYRTFPIEKDREYYFIVGQVSTDEYEHFMQWMVLDEQGNVQEEDTAKSVYEAYTHWLWAKKLPDSLSSFLEKRKDMDPDSERMEQLIERVAKEAKNVYSDEISLDIFSFISVLKDKPAYEEQIIEYHSAIKELVQQIESEQRLSEMKGCQIIDLWESFIKEYNPWLLKLFHFNEHVVLDTWLEREKNFQEEADYISNIILERNCMNSTALTISYLSDYFDGDWENLLEWHFEKTRVDPENPNPPISFKGKYKPYPVLNWIYKAFIYAILPLEALLFLGTWNTGILVTIGVQLLVFIPIIRTYRVGATLHLIFQWKEIIADKSMVIASFEADNTGSASAFKTGAILAAVIGGIMYAFSREWPLLLGFLIVAVLLYGYGELSARTSLPRTKVDFHEAWIKIGANEVWSHQIRGLSWEEERTLKIDQGKDKAAFWIRFKPEDKEAAAATLEKWCEKNNRSVSGL